MKRYISIFNFADKWLNLLVSKAQKLGTNQIFGTVFILSLMMYALFRVWRDMSWLIKLWVSGFRKRVYLTVSIVILCICINPTGVSAQTTVTFSSSGTWVCPCGVTSVIVQCWAGGGGGGGASTNNPSVGGGGGGGGYAFDTVIVSPTTSYPVTVGAGGIAGVAGAFQAGNGGSSWFKSTSTVFAAGGTGGWGSATATPGIGGAGGSANIGKRTYAGGNGLAGISTCGGGGGGGAGEFGAGGDASGTIGGVGGNDDGGDGGDGVTGNSNGNDGADFGGGGSGARRTNGGGSGGRSGGTGGAGQVILFYMPNPPVIGNWASVCMGSTTANIPCGATSAPNRFKYTVAWSVAAHTAGFTDVASTKLPANHISLTVPSAAPSAMYAATIVVLDTVAGCTSSTTITLCIVPSCASLPTVASFQPQTFCATAYPTLYNTVTFSLRETTATDFDAGQSNKTILISLPPGFEFNTATGPTVTINTAITQDITINSYSWTSSVITVQLTSDATANSIDCINFNNFQIRATAAGSYGDVLRTGGTFKINGSTGIPISSQSLGYLATNTPSVYNFSSVSQYDVTDVYRECTYRTNSILEIKIDISGGSCTPFDTISRFVFNTAGDAGTTNTADILKASVYYTGLTSGFNNSYFFGSVSNPSGAFTITGKQSLNFGSGTYYFYLVYTVSSTATIGDKLDASMSSFMFNGISYSNMSTPSPAGSRSVASGSCSHSPDLVPPTANLQTITKNSLVIPMDTSHQKLWAGYPFNIKAYGLVNALLQNDIPVKWIIKTGKAQNGIDFSANVARVYPTAVAAANQDFRASAFVVDSFWVNHAHYAGGKTATEVMTSFAVPKKVAVYKLTSDVSNVDVRYTLNQRPKVAIFSNGGYQNVQKVMLDSAGISDYVVQDAGDFAGLSECYTFCSESHWDYKSNPDIRPVQRVVDFVNEGGNFLAQCAGIDLYENHQPKGGHFLSTQGVDFDNVTTTNTYSNPDMAFGQFQGTIASRGGTISTYWPLSLSVYKPEMFEDVTAPLPTTTMVASAAHLAPPDSVGSNVFYLGGHSYMSTLSGTGNAGASDQRNVLNYINGTRLYLNAMLVPARRPTSYPISLPSDPTVCSGQGVTIGPVCISTATYSWSPTTGLSSSSACNPIASPSVTTDYTVIGFNGSCIMGPSTMKVIVTPTPDPPSISANGGLGSVCEGTSLSLSATSSAASATYSWTGPNGFTSSYQNPVIASVTTAAQGIYSVSVTSNGCTGTPGTSTVTVSVAPVANAGRDTSVCKGLSYTVLGSSATNYSALNWTSSGSGSFTNGTTLTPTYIPSGADGTLGSVKLYLNVTGLNSCGVFKDSMTLVFSSLPIVSIAASSTSVCIGQGTRLTASGANTYSWDNGISNGVNFNPTSTKTYTVTGTDVMGCSNSVSTTITVNALPNVTASASSGTICLGQSVMLSGGGALSYSWDNGVSNGVSFAPATSKTYSVTATDANGCSNAASQTIIVKALPVVTASASVSAVCIGQPITLSGSGALSYSWNNGVSNAVAFNPASTLTYTVTGTDANGCVNTASQTVTVHPLPTVSASSTLTSVCFGQSTSISGNGASSYVWDQGLGSGVSFVVNPTSTTSYQVTGTDANGCSNLASVTILVNPLPSITVNSASVCLGGNAVLTAGGAVNYSWDYGLGSGSSQTVSPASTTIYLVTGTDSNGCSASSSSTVFVHSLPNVAITASSSALCVGNGASLTVSGAQTYVWGSGLGSNSAIYVTPLTTTTYTVSGTDANSCQNSASITVTVNSIPIVSVGASSTSVCFGQSTSVSANGASSYVWDQGLGSGVSFVVNSTSTTSYQVTGTDANGCSNSASVTILVNPLPSITVNSASVCLGGNAVLTAGGAVNYSWDHGLGSSSSQTVSPASTTIYLVTGTDSNGCSASSSSTVFVHSLPNVAIAASSSALCVGNGASLTVSGAQTYVWGSSLGTNSAIYVIPLTTTTYTVNGTDANSCQNSASISITINALPMVSASVSLTAICIGQTASITGMGASTYVWDQGLGSGITFVVSPKLTTTYTLIGTDGNGCSNSASVTLLVHPPPALSLNPEAICYGGSTVLTAGGCVSYVWEDGLGSGPSKTVAPIADKTYTVTGTDINGCVTSSSATVIVHSLPSVSISSVISAFCVGNGTSLSASGAEGYVWADGLGATSTIYVTPLTTTTYSIIGTDSNLCQNSASVTITVYALPTVAASVSIAAICIGDVASVFGTGASSYVWDNGLGSAATVAVSPENTTTYTVVGTDGNSCSNSASVTLLVHPRPALSLNPDAICLGGSTVLTAGGCVSYTWDSGLGNGASKTVSPTSDHTYTVTGTDSNGCVTASSATVVVHPLPLVTVSSSSSAFCIGNGTSLSASGAQNYIWADGLGATSTISINPLTTTTYSVTGTDSNICQNSASITITVHSLPMVAASASTPAICLGQTANISASGAVSYVWDQGLGAGDSFTVNPNNTTIYNVTGTDGNGCSNTASLTLKVNSLPVVTVNSAAICFGQSAILTASGADTYIWDSSLGNGASQTVSPTLTTHYTVTGTDGNGCSSVSSATVLVNSLPTVTISAGTTAFCIGNGTSLSASGAQNYIWADGLGATSTIFINPLTTTTYTVTGTDSNICQNSASITITVHSLPMVAASASTTAICLGQTANISASGAVSYVWDQGLGAGDSFTANPNNTTIYNVTGTDGNGCSNTASLTLIVNSLPLVTVNSAAICFGQSAILTASGADTYTWDSSLGNGASQTVSPTLTTHYTVTGTDGNGCSSVSSATVLVNSLPTVTISAGTTAFCIGNGTSLSASGAQNYIWADGLGATSTISINPLTTTTYSVTGTDSNICQNSASITITVHSLPMVAASASTTAICFGQTANISASGAVSYVWDQGLGAGDSFTVNPNNTTIYNVTGTDGNGCSNTASLTLKVNSLPVVTVNSAAICFGQSAILTASGADTYIWDSSLGNGASQTVSPTLTTHYTVTGTDGNGCSSVSSATVLVNSLPTVTISAGTTAFCIGNGTSLSASGAQNYIWADGLGATSTIFINPLTTTTYTVTGTDSNICQNSASITITVHSLPMVAASASTTAICLGQTANISASGAVSYVWDQGLGAGDSFTANPNNTTIYNVTGTDGNGCSNTASLTLIVNSLPLVTVNSAAICFGQSAILTASGADTYTWDSSLGNGASQTVSPTLTTHYTVTGTDGNGCSSVSSATVLVNSLPTVTISAGTTAFCIGNGTSLSASGAQNYIWADGLGATSTISINPLTTTTYSVTGTDSNICQNSASITITVHSLPMVAASASTTAICFGQTANISASGAVSYVWDQGLGAGDSFTVNPNNTTIYNVTGTDGNGCSNTASLTLKVNSLPVVTVNSAAICFGQSAILTASGADTYIWDSSLGNGASQTVSLTLTTHYTVTGTDGNGCSSVSSATVLVNSLPTVTISAGITAFCIGNGTSLSASGAQNYIWADGLGATSTIFINPLTTTTYSVTGTDSNICQNSASITITVHSLPMVAASASITAICLGQTANISASGAVSYVWDQGLGAGDSFTVNPNNTTIYNVTGTDGNGCSSTASLTLVVNPLPVISSSPVTACEGQSALLTASGAVNYVWSDGLGWGASVHASPMVSTTYTVTGADSNLCSASTTVQLTIQKKPEISLTSTHSVCAASPYSLLVGDASISNHSTYFWTSTGQGILTKETTLKPAYQSVAADTLTSEVYLVLHVSGQSPCAWAKDSTKLNILPFTYSYVDVTICYGETYTLPSGRFASLAGTYKDTISAVSGCDSIVTTRLLVSPAPSVKAGNDFEICELSSSIDLNGTVSGSTSSGEWTTLGYGSFLNGSSSLSVSYGVSSADILADSVVFYLTSTNNGNCFPVQDTVVVRFVKAPQVSILSVDTACAGADISLGVFITGGTGQGHWSTSNGLGQFVPNDSALKAVYRPSVADTTKLQFVFKPRSDGYCSSLSFQKSIAIRRAPEVDAGADQILCANNGTATVNVSKLKNATRGFWSTLGTGSFVNANSSLGNAYIPSDADTTAGRVYLRFTTTDGCRAVTDSLSIRYTDAPSVNAGGVRYVCKGLSSIVLDGVVSGGASSGIWQTLGSGYFSDNTDLKATYYFSSADTSKTQIRFILRSTNTGLCLANDDTLKVIFTTLPTVDAGLDAIICANAKAPLTGSISGGSGSGRWTTSGMGSFLPSDTARYASYYPAFSDTLKAFITVRFTSLASCVEVSDSAHLSVKRGPQTKLGADVQICETVPSVNLSAEATSWALPVSWKVLSGNGVLSASTGSSVSYSIGTADKSSGLVTIIDSTTNNGTCGAAYDTLQIRIVTLPVIATEADFTACLNDTIPLSATLTGGTGQVKWYIFGDGAFVQSNTKLNTKYLPGPDDMTKTALQFTIETTDGVCTNVDDNLTVHFTALPVADAGEDKSLCVNNPSVSLTGVLTNATSGKWSTNGSGIFLPSDVTMAATYKPSVADLSRSEIKLWLKPTATVCKSDADTLRLNIVKAPTVSVGADKYICPDGSAIPVSAVVSGSSTKGRWKTTGNGYFKANDTILNNYYQAGSLDISQGKVVLFAESRLNGLCIAVADSLTIYFTSTPVVSAGADQVLCANNARTNLQGAIAGVYRKGRWSALNGSGTFAPSADSLSCIYYPSASDTAIKNIKLVLASTQSCVYTADTMQIQFTPAPNVDAGLTQNVCVSSAEIVLNGKITGGASEGEWTSSGTGYFLPDNISKSTRYMISVADRLNSALRFKLVSTNNGNCNSVSDTVGVSMIKPAQLSIVSDNVACSGSSLPIKGIVAGGTGAGQWSVVSGSGLFSDANSLVSTYIPSVEDAASATVIISLTSISDGYCNPVSTQKTIVIKPLPILELSSDEFVCFNNRLTYSSAKILQGATKGRWVSGGVGVFTPSDSALSITYMPSDIDAAKGWVYLKFGNTDGCQLVEDSLKITITPAPIVNAGGIRYICKGTTSINISGSVSGTSTTGQWRTLGDGAFNNPGSLSTSYYLGSNELVANKATLVLSSTGNGNCLTVTDTLRIVITPMASVSAGSDTSVCANDSALLVGKVSNNKGIWKSSGAGHFYPSDTSLNARYIPLVADAGQSLDLILSSREACVNVTDTLILKVLNAPEISAGADAVVCQTAPNVSLKVTGTAWAFPVHWVTNGDGSFSPSAASTTLTYIPGVADTASGRVTLTVRTTQNAACRMAVDTVKITIVKPPKVDAGNVQIVCQADTAVLQGWVSGGSGRVKWSSLFSDGHFTLSDTLLQTRFKAGASDVSKTSVILKLSANGDVCSNASDTVRIRLIPSPIANAGVDAAMCFNNPFVQLNGSVQYASSGIWGGGVGFNPSATVLNPNYSATGVQLAAGSFRLWLTTQGNGSCTPATDSVRISIIQPPLVDAGKDKFVCIGTQLVNVSGTVSGITHRGRWSTMGDGSFVTRDTVLDAVYKMGANDISTKKVMLVLSSRDNAACLAITDTLSVYISSAPNVNAGTDQTLCANNADATLAGIVTGGNGTGVWKAVNGSGYFTPSADVLSSVYHPSAIDTAKKYIILTLTATDACVATADTLRIHFTSAPHVDAGSHQYYCTSVDVVTLNGLVQYGATTGLWTTANQTNIASPSNLNTSYTLTEANKQADSVFLVLTSTNNGNCKAEADTVCIYSKSTPIANFIIPDSVCLNSSVAFSDSSIISHGKIVSRQWGIDGEVYTDSVVNHTFTVSGQYSITYAITTDIGCSSSASKTITVMKLPTANFVYSRPCTNTPVDFEGQGSQGDWWWNYGNGNTGTGQNPPSQQYPAPGTYSVEVLYTDAHNCSVSVSKTVVIHPTPEAAFTLDVICPDFYTRFRDRSTIVGDNIVRYHWDFGDGDTSNLRNPKHLYMKPQETVRIMMVAFSLFCTDTLVQNVKAQGNPLITASDSVGCSPHTVQFESDQPETSYFLWNFGDGFTSSQAKPSHQFVNTDTVEKRFDVLLISETEQGCIDSARKIIVVKPKPRAAFTSNPAQLKICSGTEVQLINSSHDYKSVSWRVNGLDISTSETLNYTFKNASQLTASQAVLLKAISADGCADSVVSYAEVYGIPIVNIVSKDPACDGESVKFSTASGGALYNWDFGDGATENSGDVVYHEFKNKTLVDQMYTVSLNYKSLQLCSSAASRTIKVRPAPVVNFSFDKSEGCTPLTVKLSNATSNTVSLKWYFSDNDSSTLSSVDKSFSNTTLSQAAVSARLTVINNFGCQGETSETFNVYPNPKAAFTCDSVGCSPYKPVFKDVSLNASSWLWNFGSNNKSSSQNPTHTFVNESGSIKTESVTLTAISVFGCRDSVTYSNLKVYPQPKSYFNLDNNSGCSPFKAVMHNLSQGASSYRWNFGNSNSSTTDSAAIYRLYRNVGASAQKYVVELIAIDDVLGCTDTSYNTLEVFPAVEALFTCETVGCSPAEVHFVSQSTNVKYYTWNFGDGNTATSASVNKTYTNLGDVETMFNAKLVTHNEFLCSDTAVKIIGIYPKPKADFTITPNSGCSPFTAQLSNLTKNASEFVWDFGDSKKDSTTSFLSSHVYSHSSTIPQTFVLTLRVKGAGGCSDTVDHTVTVNPQVKAGFSPVTAGCSPLTVTMENTSDDVFSYAWDFGDLAISGLKNPSHAFINKSVVDTVYTVKLTAKSIYECSAEYSDTIRVYAEPELSYTVDPSYMVFPQATVNITNLTKGNWDYLWDFGDNTTSTETNNLSHTYKHYGTFKIMLRAHNKSCFDTLSHTVVVRGGSPVAAYEATFAGCAPLSVNFVNKSAGAIYYEWHFGDGGMSNEESPAYTYSRSGEFTVELIARNDYSESVVNDQKVTVYTKARPFFQVAPNLVDINDKLGLINKSENSVRYKWEFGNGDTSNLQLPVYAYQSEGVYSIQLAAWSENGCPDTMLIEDAVKVEMGCKVLLPNAFTPNTNGPSGGKYDMLEKERTNDIFHPLTKNISDYELTIFNRWGEQLFKSTDLAIGWDGYFEGKLSKSDVYIWKLKAKCINGREIVETGTVVLIR